MKKFMLFTLLALSYLAAQPVKHNNPTPTCNPCPFVR